LLVTYVSKKAAGSLLTSIPAALLLPLPAPVVFVPSSLIVRSTYYISSKKPSGAAGASPNLSATMVVVMSGGPYLSLVIATIAGSLKA